jgi:hypothetical protein
MRLRRNRAVYSFEKSASTIALQVNVKLFAGGTNEAQVHSAPQRFNYNFSIEVAHFVTSPIRAPLEPFRLFEQAGPVFSCASASCRASAS